MTCRGDERHPIRDVSAHSGYGRSSDHVTIRSKQNSAQNIKDNGADPAKIDACIVNIKAAADCAGTDTAAKCG